MIKQFKTKHLDGFTPSNYIQGLFNVDEGFERKIYSMAEHGEAVTCFNGDKVICIFVWYPYFKDHYKIMLIPSNDFDSHVKTAVKGIKEVFIAAFKVGVVKVETDSIDDPVINRWHEFLGFKREGVRPNHVNGEDYVTWGIYYGD